MARILLVEDNELNRDMLSRRLSRRGHEVVEDTDGAAALALAASERADLILMDRSLPGRDGWEAPRRLKAVPAPRPIPVIARHRRPGDGMADPSTRVFRASLR